MASFGTAIVVSLLVGCEAKPGSALTIATTWPVADRKPIEAIFRAKFPELPPIEWISLETCESLANAVDRRTGVDLILGAPPWEFERLGGLGKLAPIDSGASSPWMLIGHRTLGRERSTKPLDASFISQARATLKAEGWPHGYETLVRSLASFSSNPQSTSRLKNDSTEGVALIRGQRHSDKAQELIKLLEKSGIVSQPTSDVQSQARADSLLADLLRSAFVDAAAELHDASLALVRYDHPAKAEQSLGERPPWPPASVAKLLEATNGEVLVETLLEQIAPEPAAREWLKESWHEAQRPIDGDLLLQIARAADGQLVNEPRFRNWLRAEWTAWSRQLYRRVARVAGGYVPS